MTRSCLASRKSRERGVTLVELSITLVVAGVIMSSIAYTTQHFFRFYNQQLEKATAQQTGRVAVDLLRDYTRRAGWGFQPNATANGHVMVGACFDDTVPSKQSQICNNLPGDGNSDRLRIAYGDPAAFQAFISGVATSAGTPVVFDELNTDDPFANGIQNQLIFVSGSCVGTNQINHVLGFGSVDDGPTGTFLHNFHYTPLETSPPVESCGGSGRQDYNFGKLHVADFKIDRTLDPLHPILLLRLDPRVSWDPENEAVLIIARDVEQFQVEYGIDRNSLDTLDRVPDIWCSEPGDTNGSCALGLSAAENYSRITALRIEIVVRSERFRTAYDEPDTSPEMDVLDYTIPDLTDGYRRWKYRAVVALRNNSI